MATSGRDRKAKRGGGRVDRVRGNKGRGEGKKAVGWEGLEIHQIKAKL